MASGKIIGYALSIAGLAGIVFSKKLSTYLTFLGAKASIYTMVAALALVVVGVVLISSESSGSNNNVKHASEEVPIYEGEGKKRKIVGYHRSK